MCDHADTCLRANVSQTFLDVKYDQGKRGESPGQCTPTILCMEVSVGGTFFFRVHVGKHMELEVMERVIRLMLSY